MPLQASWPCCVVNVPNDYFYMAGFEVTLHGRFWASAEGDITFEWYSNPTRVLSVSVGPNNELHYAGLFGASRAYGTEVFHDQIPESFFLTLRERFSKVQSPHDPKTAIGDDERLARYIFSARHFSREKLRVKAEAFMPSRGEVSVFRIDGWGEEAIWKIGNDVALKREQTLYAGGDTKANDKKHIR